MPHAATCAQAFVASPAPAGAMVAVSSHCISGTHDNLVVETADATLKEKLEVAFNYAGETRLLMVQRSQALRDVQQLLCRAFYQRFPMQAASLKIAGVVYDDFEDMPFLTLEDVETPDVKVEFELASDMYHFDMIDRRRQPSPDPFDEIPELALE